jgi:hypothetical protein
MQIGFTQDMSYDFHGDVNISSHIYCHGNMHLPIWLAFEFEISAWTQFNWTGLYEKEKSSKSL